VTAVAPGIIARSGDGAVILDLDNDADESTGWTIFYLHLTDVIAPGTQVNVGDILGYSSCAGGFSTATHLHIARRFNGEWLPADCSQCIPGHERPAFVMSGWRTLGIANAEYQGFLENGTTQLQAEQGRNNPINQISW
jgi:murein DD-endopeptidase MepM/ murein hydrolase activator NlpD